MKSYQTYIYELNKVYEFRVKIAGVDPKGQVMERIKNALNAYDLDTVTTPKSIPIQEHKEFPKLGNCECWVFEVAIKYPTTSEHIRHLIKERAAVSADCIYVVAKNSDVFNEEFEAHGQDHEGALLDQAEMKEDPGGQELAGQARVDSLLKELSARTYEFEKDSKEAGKTTNSVPTGDTSPVGTHQNNVTASMKKVAK